MFSWNKPTWRYFCALGSAEKSRRPASWATIWSINYRILYRMETNFECMNWSMIKSICNYSFDTVYLHHEHVYGGEEGVAVLPLSCVPHHQRHTVGKWCENTFFKHLNNPKLHSEKVSSIWKDEISRWTESRLSIFKYLICCAVSSSRPRYLRLVVLPDCCVDITRNKHKNYCWKDYEMSSFLCLQ